MGKEPYAELKVNIPTNEGFLSRLFKSIVGSEGETGGEPQVESEPKQTEESGATGGMSLVKSASGKWLWFARYSNKYLDDDHPREIISEESHLNFVKQVSEGNVDYPELWIHHIPGTAWGKATWVGYDNGFAVAAGYVYPEHDDVAEALSKQSNLLLSHGMDPNSIVRDEQNPNIILRHETKEISPLPASRAANKLTGFVILKEDNMKAKGISDADRAILIDMGVPEEFVDRQIQDNKKLGQIADQILPSKAKETEEETLEVEAEEQAGTEEVETEEEPKVEAAAVVDDETIDAIVESIKSLNDRFNVIADYVKSIKEVQDELVGNSTKATRMAVLKSVIGTEETYVDGRTSLAKSAPKEAAPAESGAPFFFQQKGWTHGS